MDLAWPWRWPLPAEAAEAAEAAEEAEEAEEAAEGSDWASIFPDRRWQWKLRANLSCLLTWYLSSPRGTSLLRSLGSPHAGDGTHLKPSHGTNGAVTDGGQAYKICEMAPGHDALRPPSSPSAALLGVIPSSFNPSSHPPASRSLQSLKISQWKNLLGEIATVHTLLLMTKRKSPLTLLWKSMPTASCPSIPTRASAKKKRLRWYGYPQQKNNHALS